MDTYLKCPNCGKEHLMNNFSMRWVDYENTPDTGITTHFRTHYCPLCDANISIFDSPDKPKITESWLFYPGGSQSHHVPYEKLSRWQRLLNTICKWFWIKTKGQREYERLRKEWLGNPVHPIDDGKYIGIVGQLKEKLK